MAFDFENITNAVQDATSRAAKGFLDSPVNRLANSQLNPGGENSVLPNGGVATARFGSDNDTRARLALSPGAGNILYKDPSNKLLRPLTTTDGVVWPYTPSINIGYSAAYTGNQVIHNNYASQSYGQSMIEQISCVGTFTANTPAEAAYLLSVLHFLKSATKSFFGQDHNRGTPPPVLRFSAHGPYMFNSVPVVISATNFDFEQTVDYINAKVSSGSGGIDSTTRVPSSISINVTLLPVVSRQRQTEFGLAKYARGELIGEASGKAGLP